MRLYQRVTVLIERNRSNRRYTDHRAPVDHLMIRCAPVIAHRQ